MNKIAGFFSNDWANALGWALTHSLWQSLLILLVVAAALRLIPAAFSRIRYTIASGALLLFIAAVTITFAYLADAPPSTPTLTSSISAHTHTVIAHPVGAAPSFGSALSTVSRFIGHMMPLMLLLWAAGVMFSALRLSSGIYLTMRLRSTAQPLNNVWTAYVREMSARLGISRVVSLAESTSIPTPMVIGYLKPVILIPVGILSGLTTEQLETIFIHELAHIKRHDYLINSLQSVVEAIFFFNPFVRILSAWIRREREYCCDDLVVTSHGGTRAYAHALTKLAEVRLLAPAFALPLGDGKYQLLNRIKRIMEKSVKNYSAKGRMLIPVLLLVSGLLCVSWLGINAENSYQKDPSIVDQDTVKKKDQKGARYSRKSIITLDENGQPHEEVVEEFEGDEELRPLLAIPDVPVIPPNPDVPIFPPVPDTRDLPDTIPPPAFPFNGGEWEEFSNAFRQSFRNSFERLDALQDSEAFEKLKTLEEEFMSRDWKQSFFDDSVAFNLERRLDHFREFELEDLNHQLERLQEFQMHDLEEHLDKLEEFKLEHLGRVHEKLRSQEENLRRFEDAMEKELVRDGYLSEGETIESMEWHDSSFKVNGKAVKEGDMEKYRELRRKFLSEGKWGKLE